MRNSNRAGGGDVTIAGGCTRAAGVFIDGVINSRTGIGATIAALDEARREIDPKRIERVVDHLSQARQISFFALGASAPAAFDAQNKFFRFNLPVAAYNDVLMQRMVAAASHTGDVIVVISYTGRTRELVEAATIARDNGACVLGLTAAGSPLATPWLNPAPPGCAARGAPATPSPRMPPLSSVRRSSADSGAAAGGSVANIRILLFRPPACAR